jgi:hypothetical protein
MYSLIFKFSRWSLIGCVIRGAGGVVTGSNHSEQETWGGSWVDSEREYLIEV